MKTTGSLVRLVVFAVITIFLTAILASVIGNITITKSATYKATFSDVTGLLPHDEVRIAGVKVGQVSDIKIADRKFAQVTFTAEKDAHLKQSTIARIRYRNLVGQRFISLTEGPGSTAPLRENALIPLTQTTPALDLTVLFNGFKPLFKALSPKDVNSLSAEIIKTLQGEGGTFEQLLANTASLTNTIADRDAVIGRVIDNLNQVLATIDQRGATFSQLIVNFQRLVSGLASDRQAIGDSLTNINALADSTAGFIRDVRPPLAPDIVQLGATAKNLNDNTPTVEDFLQRLPSKLNAIIRTATYGSWFNFYLCSADGTVTAGPVQSGPVTLPGSNQTISPAASNPAAVCQK